LQQQRQQRQHSLADIFSDVASKIVTRVPYSSGKPAKIANANSSGFMSEPAAVRFLYKSSALATYMEIGSPDPNYLCIYLPSQKHLPVEDKYFSLSP
jgi:hypothetical protein